MKREGRLSIKREKHASIYRAIPRVSRLGSGTKEKRGGEEKGRKEK